MSRATALIVSILAAPVLANAEPFELHVGDLFVKMRKQIYAAGWRPDPLAHASTGEYMGFERRLMENGFAEVDSCSEGLTFCILQYVKDGACLRVQTQGEQIGLMRIGQWSSECRERGSDEEERPLPGDVRYAIQWRQDCELAAECRNAKRFMRQVTKKYARDPAIRRVLRSQDDP